ncbi:hypothetical protein BV22DRAFT_1131339 [Leucogyrophana mollusca]|uniref:Uncharacterized protein n=1 Tax=Leucogyrophana mollusca TaxID=85980 RepID=A0ACB8BAA8_9AGAM|nr:hypothetical protein BV22DRAFT_1131339 [Leucogyrophana mollusca]
MPHDAGFLGSVDEGLLGKFAQIILIPSPDLTPQRFKYILVFAVGNALNSLAAAFVSRFACVQGPELNMSSHLEAAIVNAANIIRITRICQLSSAIIIIYDHLITFNQEVEFIWKKPWSLATVIYLIVRYVGDGLGLLDAAGICKPLTLFLTPHKRHIIAAFMSESPSQEFQSWQLNFVCSSVSPICTLGGRTQTTPVTAGQVFLHLQGWPSAVLDWLMQIVLQMRIYALYKRSNRVLSFTALGYLAEIIAMSTILGIANAHIVAINEPIPGIGICSATNIPASFYRFWLPIIAFEGTLCLLALWVGIRDLVSGFRAQGINGINVLEVLVKDSVFYFLCLVLACVVNAAMWQTLGEAWLEVPEGFSIAAKVVIGCRLILNLPKTFAQRPLHSRVEYISMSTHSH